jgi:hypothetical protein
MLQEQENRRDEDLMWGETNEMDWDMMLESGKVGVYNSDATECG